MFDSADIEAIFSSGQLGAIPAGALFSGLLPGTGQPRVVCCAYAEPQNDSSGHHPWFEDQLS
jgi:hypothetical protein